ncbi:hypothetical protein J1N35_028923 [Gossypium stocksii]|uniref:Uncharacterized protein n=1 Tax=Gossypium stocksii TaxID=47602 RepID=A0A9D3ZRK4_9ROSI|nr:hypothetical protein J1N35_028923 [Gossypium stocksii]
MSNLAKLEFAALDILGKNYLSWVLDAEIHLDAKVAEQNNELFTKNHGIRPTGSTPFSEVNVAVHNNYENRKYRGRDHGRRRSGGRGRGCISNRYHGGYNTDTSNHHKKNDNEKQERSGQNNPSKTVENICY